MAKRRVLVAIGIVLLSICLICAILIYAPSLTRAQMRNAFHRNESEFQQLVDATRHMECGSSSDCVHSISASSANPVKLEYTIICRDNDRILFQAYSRYAATYAYVYFPDAGLPDRLPDYRPCSRVVRCPEKLNDHWYLCSGFSYD